MTETDSNSVKPKKSKIAFVYKKLLAFTLSEVLIALVVIGVVAAITVPTLVAEWQKQATITGLKKSYSTLSNAFARSVFDNGANYNWDLEGKTQAAILREVLAPYLNVAVDCIDDSSQHASCNYTFRRYRDSREYQATSPLILVDGTVIASDYGVFGYDPSNPSVPILHYFKVLVDINGYKKPNVLGRDIFFFYVDGVYYNNLKLTMKDILSYPQPRNREEKLQCCKQYGGTCAQIIMEDDWQIKDDYPW